MIDRHSKRGAQAVFALIIAVASCARTRNAGTAALAESEQAIPADLREQVQRAEHIGPMIYRLDNAAAIAGDALGLNESSPLRASLGGYLAVEETDDASAVLFYTEEADPRLMFIVHVPTRAGAEPKVEKLEPPEPTQESVRRYIRARQAALMALGEGEQPINPVVLPGSVLGEKDDILVYLLAATTRPKTVVFGRHYRVLVSADGNTVKRFEPLSKSVLVMSSDVPKEALGLFVTHLVTQAPLETHVFTSMLQKSPVYVETPRGLWRVTGSGIVFLGAHPELHGGVGALSEELDPGWAGQGRCDLLQPFVEGRKPGRAP